MSHKIDIHGSAVAINGRSVLVLGASGAGKSHLLLELMAMGAVMIGDDRVMLEDRGDSVWLAPHPNAKGRLEVRGIGIHQAKVTTKAPLHLVVDMDEAPSSRLPKMEYAHYFDVGVRKIHGRTQAALAQYIFLLLNEDIQYLNIE